MRISRKIVPNLEEITSWCIGLPTAIPQAPPVELAPSSQALKTALYVMPSGTKPRCGACVLSVSFNFIAV